jgi:hypothetical protein
LACIAADRITQEVKGDWGKPVRYSNQGIY